MKIKKLTIQTLLVLTFAMTVSSQAFAGWFDTTIDKPLPANIADLSGVFSGYQQIGDKSSHVELFIYPGPMFGSFIITLVRVSTFGKVKSAQIFYAEALEQTTLGLISLGLAENKSQIENKMPPAALLKIAVDNRNRIQNIELTAQDGVYFLKGTVKLTSTSSNFAISNTLVSGEYEGRDCSADIKIYSSGAEDVLVSGNVESLGLSNDYSLSFDLTGVGVLRSRAYTGQFQKRERPDVSAVVIPILADNKPAVIVVKVSESSNSSGQAVILKFK